MYFLIPLALFAGVQLALGATPAEWRSRSIYQVMTDRFARSDGSTTASCDPALGKYCGGSWKGLIDKLDYIQGMGFSAVWISPVTKQEQKVTADLSSYHGYWQTDLYEVNAAFGTKDDLKALSTALHSRGMYLMLDVVVNHFAWAGEGTTVDYSTFNPFNSKDYFHPYKLISNDDPNNPIAVQQDWYSGNEVTLPDVKTEDPKVAQMYYSWVKGLVSNYSVDGLRIDTVLNVNPDFFPGFNKAAGVFCTGEVFNGNPSNFCPLQDDLDSLINFPIYFDVTRAFKSSSGSITELINQRDALGAKCKDVNLLTTFSENHDVPRFASYTQDMSLAQNIITYNILSDGIPIIYQGQEQHLSGGPTPLNREATWLTNYNTSAPLYKLITSLNQLRAQAFKAADTYASSVSQILYHDDHTLVLKKGLNGSQVLTVLTNNGAGSSDQTINLNSTTDFTAGEKVMEVLTCTELTTDAAGNLNVTIHQGLPGVYYPSAGLKGSGLCGRGVLPSSSARGAPTASAGAAGAQSGKPSSTSLAFRGVSHGSVAALVSGILVLWIPLFLGWI